jgi:regulator of sigma E protease
MNGLLAVALPAGLYMFHFQKPAYLEEPARIGDVEPDSPAAQAALQPGDLIVRFGHLRNPKWEDVELETMTNVGEALPLEVSRAGQLVSITLTPRPEGPSRVGDAGWYPFWPVVIDKLEPGLPAALAGLQPGDEIVKLNGHKILFWPRFSEVLQSSQGKPAELTFLRHGKEMHAQLRPVYTDVMGDKRWRIGVDFRRDVVVRRLPFGAAVSASLKDNLRICLATFDLLGKIVTRRMSTRSLAGPIGIAQMSGEAYRAGIPDLLMVVAMISLQLGIFNLLPIPVLDGGVILFLLIESVMQRDLSLEVKARVVQAGIVFLLLLAVFVMYNDIVKVLRPS